MSFNINNRRYTGCKAKLCNWIRDVILNNCKNCKSFCDLFAGTGVVTYSLINDFNDYIINDFLYSNEIIYKSFYLKQDYSEPKLYKFLNTFNDLKSENIKENYVSKNYGNKYFSLNDSLKIGEIRNLIEANKKIFNEKEYSILLASLLFSADKCANTCGHYDAFFTKKKLKDYFKFELINPVIQNKTDKRNIKIFREDSNFLAKSIVSEIVYIDPPYSSRQYSRFYHVLEVLTKWDFPKLTGTAKKPPLENMSDYCKNNALDSFKSLIYSLKCKYIIVSYNNTYNSKSSSSKNKMKLDDIKQVLNCRGATKLFKRKYRVFNAGKTNIKNHEEMLFVCKVED